VEKTATNESSVKKQVGLWIDHKKAVIVTFTDKGQEIKQISGHLERDAQHSGGWDAHSGKDYGEDDRQDKRFTGHLDRYYDEVIAFIHDADSILIFGPGEAKGELKKRIESKGRSGHIVDVETVDEMTDPQITAKVREHFLKENPQSGPDHKKSRTADITKHRAAPLLDQ
jgi:stalled ribosome rescue protein Dom34